MITADTKGAALFYEIRMLFSTLVAEDKRFITIALIYGLAISFLTLAVPVSVQMLINTVANTASQPAVLTLAIVLFGLLLVYGALTALQTYAMELFERRFYARITSEFTLRTIYADHSYFQNINRYELVNRYFDIMSVQKIVSGIVIGLFGLVLQMIVGIVLVSFYHPWLLVFNLCFIFILWLIWRVWGYHAIRTAISVSEAKYDTARHLETVALANSFFKSQVHIDHAIAKTDTLSRHYILNRISHFRFTFSQHIGLLLLYALASAGLLGLGGILVINNELTLGQLVAAELILSVIFYGVTRFGHYLLQFYDLSAALEEISRIFAVPLETREGRKNLPEGAASLAFDRAHYAWGEQKATLNFNIAAGQKVLASVAFQPLQDNILQTLKRYDQPQAGHIRIADADILDYEKHALRSHVVILDLPNIIEASVLEYMRICAPNAAISEIKSVLREVELDEEIALLPEGLDTQLTLSGAPLTSSQTLRLKLAGAILQKPRLLILNQLFDMISYKRRQRIFAALCAHEEITLLYFTNRKDVNVFDSYLYIGHEEQCFLDSLEALRAHEEATDKRGTHE